MAISNVMSIEFYTLYTLVDITATGVLNTIGDETKRNQQRNWETVLQVCGIRAQPVMVNGPTMFDAELSYFDFGEFYSGRQNIWCACIGIEHKDVYLVGDNPVAGLEKDFEQVPVITGLNETAKFILPIFHTHGAIKNIYFKPGQIDLNNI